MSARDTLPMTEAKLDHPEPWTEAEYLKLDETSNRIELIDGGLWVRPGPSRPHRDVTRILLGFIWPAARAVGLRTHAPSNLRLAPGRILIPDLVVAKVGRLGNITDAGEAVLVCEITSPSNAATDRLLKMHLYAAAGIEWYLLVEPDMTEYESITVRLLRLRGEHYVEHAVASDGDALRSDLPFTIDIPVTALLDFQVGPAECS